MKKNTPSLLYFVFLFLISCGAESIEINEIKIIHTMMEPKIDSFIYEQTDKIGTQVWMKKNLNNDKFRNGDTIPQAKTVAEWEKAGKNKKPTWCYYNFDPANGTKYGKLYNWYAVNDPRGLAPKGWHIPSDTEWTKLSEYIGGDEIAGKKLKSKEGWLPFEGKNSNGDNIFGFDALPGGYYGFYAEAFDQIEFCGAWWTATENENLGIWIRTMSARLDTIDKTEWEATGGFSVRCVKD